MTRAARGLALLLGVGALLALLGPGEGAEHTATSYGTGPQGQRALHELLVERDLSPGRSLDPPSRLEPGDTVWWIEPDGLCGEEDSDRGLRAWMERGGTAVVFLPPPPAEERAASDEEAGGAGPPAPACDALAGLALPPRTPGAGPELEGPRLPRRRALPLASPHAFAGPGEGWQAALRAGARPFALERSVGEGRLVAVADARFLHNAHLGEADAAPLAVDLVRAYGRPRIDERAHGFVPETHPVRYVARSPAAPLFLGLIALGGLAAWRGSAWPRPQAWQEPEDPERTAPSLERFVASLADLYARSGDHARVAERYRELCAARIRRRLGLPAGLPVRALVERLERDGRAPPGRLRLLEAPPPRDAAGLRQRVRALDGLVEEVTA